MTKDQMKELEAKRDYCAKQAKKLSDYYAGIAGAKDLIDAFADEAKRHDAEIQSRQKSK
jgi:hypothetical protein